MSDRLCKFYSAPPLLVSAAESQPIGDAAGRAIKSLARAVIGASRQPRLPITAYATARSIASLRGERSLRPSADLIVAPSRCPASRTH